MKLLDGQELAGFIKERQAKQVRALRQAHYITPSLSIIVTIDSPVTDVYMSLKQAYGNDILVDVRVYRVSQKEAKVCIDQLNADSAVHGIILQLPLDNPNETEELCNIILPKKDVDGLGSQSTYEPATPLAIRWLLAGYGIDLAGKKIVIVGQGKLVGAPLTKALISEGYDVKTADVNTKDLQSMTLQADIIITATGSPSLLKSEMIKENTVVVDAGTASDSGKVVGDVDAAVFERNDLTITPPKGGVGPLTICALFDNTIRAATEYV